MKAKNDKPDNKFTSALEAINNLLLPELDQILSGAWSAALAANSEIKIRPINLRTGPFHRHLAPLLKELVSALAGAYRRYFKLALAHPGQVGDDPNGWALAHLQPFVIATIDWIRDWYMLACDGLNRYVQPVGSVPFQPGQTASISILVDPQEIASPKSWRAPSWLFAVGAVVGIGPLKTQNVPARDSEEKLSAAHTRLLLKGVRRVFLGMLVVAIETVRNEEIAAAAAFPSSTVFARSSEPENRKRAKHQPKGTEGLGQKKADLSQYMLEMTDKQRLAFSLKYEYELRLTEIASRMGIDRTTAREHLDAANRRLRQNRAFEKRKANRSKSNPDE
jgi:RNA polymerase sigma factor (sigma-70 family)